MRVAEQVLRSKWDEPNSFQEKWNTLKTALCDEAKTELGYEDRKALIGLGRVRKMLGLSSLKQTVGGMVESCSGNVFVTFNEEELQKLAEDELPKSQCGFRKVPT